MLPSTKARLVCYFGFAILELAILTVLVLFTGGCERKRPAQGGQPVHVGIIACKDRNATCE
jgi:hypothetical protein